MKKTYVIGIGGANLDICGKTSGKMLMKDSNIGNIHLSAGGVCRNICENTARMGACVSLISAVGDDPNGRILLQACENAGIDTKLITVLSGYRTGSYLSLHDEDGDMVTAINDMEIIDHLTPELIVQADAHIRDAAAIVIDANLSPNTLNWICKTYGSDIPIFADTVSCAKATRFVPVLSKIHTIKPNLMEAQLLTGQQSAEDCADFLLKQGVQHVCISAGSKGVYYRSREEGFWISPKPLTNVVNATGAGDCLMGGLLAGYLLDLPLKERIQFAVTASVLTLQSEDTIRKDLCEKLIFDSIKECII